MNLRMWRAAGLGLAALAGLGLAAEAFCRYGLGLGTPPLYQADPELEYIFVPNQELRRFGHRIAINNLGLRGTAVAPFPAAGTERLLLFGDSILWGGAQLDQAQIATTLLPGLLPASASGAPVEVVAAAVPSWGPANWLAFARRHGVLGAREVLLVLSSHDATDWPSFEPLARQSDKPTQTPRLALQEAIGRYGWPALQRRLGGPVAPRGPALPVAEQERRSLAALAELIALLRAQGAVVRALQFWDRAETAAGRPGPGHGAIAAVLSQAAVPTGQAGPALARCARRAGLAPAALFADEIHPYTPLGQRCLAEAIGQALAQ